MQNKNELIEPHQELLTKPSENALLYKIVSLRFLTNMINQQYLYFNRVDTYHEDKKDSDQPLSDKNLSETSKFMTNPNYNARLHYDSCRSRTYACCFSLENSNYIWRQYGSAAPSVCLVFNSSKLINFFNNRYYHTNLLVDNQLYGNIFSINYGLINYGEFKDRYMKELLPNPMEYTYFKDNYYHQEKEFRISLSCGGLGSYQFNKTLFVFPKFLHLDFNYKAALESGALQGLILPVIRNPQFSKKFDKLKRIAHLRQIDLI